MEKEKKIRNKKKEKLILLSGVAVIAVAIVTLIIFYCTNKVSYTPILTSAKYGEGTFDTNGRDTLQFTNANTFSIKVKDKVYRLPCSTKDFGTELKLNVSANEQERELAAGVVTDPIKAKLDGADVSVSLANTGNKKEKAQNADICSLYISAAQKVNCNSITLPCDVRIGDSIASVTKKYGKPKQTYTEGSTKIYRWVSFRKILIEIGEKESLVTSMKIMPLSEE